MTLPASYPEEASPLCDLSETTEYFTTPFLVRVEEALTARLSKMPPRFSTMNDASIYKIEQLPLEIGLSHLFGDLGWAHFNCDVLPGQ